MFSKKLKENKPKRQKSGVAKKKQNKKGKR